MNKAIMSAEILKTWDTRVQTDSHDQALRTVVCFVNTAVKHDVS